MLKIKKNTLARLTLFMLMLCMTFTITVTILFSATTILSAVFQPIK